MLITIENILSLNCYNIIIINLRQPPPKKNTKNNNKNHDWSLIKKNITKYKVQLIFLSHLFIVKAYNCLGIQCFGKVKKSNLKISNLRYVYFFNIMAFWQKNDDRLVFRERYIYYFIVILAFYLDLINQTWYFLLLQLYCF